MTLFSNFNENVYGLNYYFHVVTIALNQESYSITSWHFLVFLIETFYVQIHKLLNSRYKIKLRTTLFNFHVYMFSKQDLAI